MKNIKRLGSILLSLFILLAMVLPSFAEGELADMEGPKDDGSITINNAVIGQTYTLYQVLYLESYDKAGNNYSYKPTETWKNFLTTEATEYISIDPNSNYAKWVGDETPTRAEAFSKLAISNITNYSIKPVAQKEATGVSVEFTGLKLGYYMVDTTVGTLCSLSTTNTTMTVNDKNTRPTNIKSVQENGTYGTKNDVSVGAVFNYMSTIDAKKGAENYVFHDKPDKGITFDEVTKISVKSTGDTSTEKTLTAYDSNENSSAHTKYDYKVVLPADRNTTFDDGCAFHVEFSQSFLDTLLDSNSIDIYYTAHLNQDAVVAGDGNINTSWLVYGDNIETTKTQTVTKTWKVGIDKFTDSTGKKIQLKGATFKLCTAKEVEETTKETVYTDLGFSPVPDKNADGTVKKDESGNIVYVPNTYMRDSSSATVTFTTDETGRINLQGLDSGVYYLFEEKAPDGYNKLTSAITINIDADGKIKQNQQEITDGYIPVRNNSGGIMPTTGGIGTTIFYIVGSVLLVGAGVLLVVRKRMSSAKESNK